MSAENTALKIEPNASDEKPAIAPVAPIAISSAPKIEVASDIAARPIPTPIKIVPKINPISESPANISGTIKSENQSVAFLSKCKVFSPAVGTVVGLFDGALYRFIRNKVNKTLLPSEQVAEICEPLKRSPESKKALNESLTRIIARRTDNEEIMDYVVVGTAIGETAIGIADVLSELRKIAAMLEKQKIQSLSDEQRS